MQNLELRISCCAFRVAGKNYSSDELKSSGEYLLALGSWFLALDSKIKRIILSILILLTFQNSTNAQTCDSITKAFLNKCYIKSYFTDSKEIITSPFKWDKKDRIKAGVILGTTALLFAVDEPISTFFQDHRTKSSNDISKNLLEPWGTKKLYRNYTVATLGALYLQGLIFKNERSKKTAMLGTKAFILTGLFHYLPQPIIGRQSPIKSGDPYNFDWLSGKESSFISGHTATAFSVATIIASEYKDKIAIPILAYSIASCVGLSRLNDNKHWASDVFAGAAFGYAIGKLIYNENNWGIQLTPYKTSNHTGMSLSIPVK